MEEGAAQDEEMQGDGVGDEIDLSAFPIMDAISCHLKQFKADKRKFVTYHNPFRASRFEDCPDAGRDTIKYINSINNAIGASTTANQE